ncbi:MAG: bifunctional UDP-N-acetylglucosamine diphosphorylase/glucosamine-1-phosphate N-acetyltransferase GlmU [Ruminococcus sp.]|jgi:bifunctional UDP-N-acetylglucosamine pyrophosphorylase/glucosamine-1-phosphate N-acetyltransferase|nr:bifunctional UDP-N-acetylglucosamine diphosphorylase/glucosamine-1-phosphate N-acetyltransferase GlmU [Ruminococcus sp.]
MSKTTSALILAGGSGKRMQSNQPKPMFELLGEPMIEWVLSSCETAGLSDICVVTGFGSEILEDFLNRREKVYPTVLQPKRMGTGHAVMEARNWLREYVRYDGDVLVLYGDCPLLGAETIQHAYKTHCQNENAVTVITAEALDPKGYGRIIKDKDKLLGIAEEHELSDNQRTLREVFSGAMWFNIRALLFALGEIEPNNAENEYYLTDTIFILGQSGYKTGVYKSHNPDIILGADDRRGLLKLNDTIRRKLIEFHLDNGVEFTCTDGVTVGRKVKLGSGVKIMQGSILSGETSVGDNTQIGVNCLIDNCKIGSNCNLNSVQAYDSTIMDNVSIGPFVRIRPGSIIRNGVKIGNFVEVKNSDIGEKTAIAHLTYVGDSDVGSGVNFGCGAVTSNYDGKNKYRTTIEDGAFIGCNTNLIAPVKVGKRGYTAAGSTITQDVPDGSLAIERVPTVIKEGYSDKKLKQ